ncbi:hypothetical protein EIP91_011890 [Steccherinum ochraceum]|uniref:Protein kinase domain-containing protein n=1 Tax=Steccherinum ochraceum TaxID=92696 RepID=A0A4R0RVF8_9APHY|nr:hypothetical protein EIP91_011890 [Steccherinum ochraceum]
MTVSKSYPKSVPGNAFSNVSIAGITQNTGKKPGTLRFSRTGSEAREPFIVPAEHYPNPAPKSPPTRLPPAGDLSLSLALGSELGCGSVGRVFEVNVIKSASSPMPRGKFLPSLVVKMSRRGMSRALLYEAHVYEDLERLQGIVIPRCFGLYVGTVTDAANFTPWSGQAAQSPLGDHRDTHGSPDDEVTILILERVGGCITAAESRKSLHSELYTMYKDISSFSIYHFDIKPSHILLATPESSIAAGHSHRWAKPYQFRIIGFHNSQKTNVGRGELAEDQMRSVSAVLNELALAKS